MPISPRELQAQRKTASVDLFPASIYGFVDQWLDDHYNSKTELIDPIPEENIITKLRELVPAYSVSDRVVEQWIKQLITTYEKRGWVVQRTHAKSGMDCKDWGPHIWFSLTIESA